ncbi:MAG: orotate phosphoribosyltransferase [Phycisphaerales bacterium]|nr:orotate phosphoribosyltransferase [Phycisphaerales bacterium]
MNAHARHKDGGLVEAMLRETHALLEGHFLLSSGLHSDRYCQCAKLLEHPEKAARCAAMMAELIGDAPVDVVLAPALGGVVWGYELARALGTRSIFAERDETRRFSLRRGFALQAGERVLIAEDVVTTGKSVMELSPLIAQAGAEIVGYASIVDRSGGKFDGGGVGVPFWSLAALEFETFERSACPMCAKGMVAVKPGSRPDAAVGKGV